MKTTLLVAALLGLSSFAASACPYKNVSAQADKPMTVAGIDAAKDGQKAVTQTPRTEPRPAEQN